MNCIWTQIYVKTKQYHKIHSLFPILRITRFLHNDSLYISFPLLLTDVGKIRIYTNIILPIALYEREYLVSDVKMRNID
jgi:hypothetical protein